MDPHRAIDWLSTFPQVVLVAVGETGDGVAVRFQDASLAMRGPWSMPGSRRIRSLPAPQASWPMPPSDQRVLARAVMNGETSDPATPGGRCFRHSSGSTSQDRARSEAILDVSLAVAGAR